MKKIYSAALAILIHLLLVIVLIISWQHYSAVSFSSEKEPVVWLSNKSQLSRLNHQIQIVQTHLNGLSSHQKTTQHTDSNKAKDQAITSPQQHSSELNSFTKMLHDKISTQLLQNIKDNDIAINQNYSFTLSFKIDSFGQIDSINLASQQALPDWLNALARRSLHEISPVSLPNPQLGNSSYQIPINLELTQ